MLKSQSRFIPNHYFVVTEFKGGTHALLRPCGIRGETCTFTRTNVYVYIHVLVRVCACLLLGSLWGCKLYHLLQCTQHTLTDGSNSLVNC